MSAKSNTEPSLSELRAQLRALGSPLAGKRRRDLGAALGVAPEHVDSFTTRDILSLAILRHTGE
jgi:hypothetical protein